MLSFSKVVTLAAVAFGVFTQAAPLNQRDASLNVRVPSPATSEVAVLGGVLVDLGAKLEVVLQPLHCITKDNATISLISPVVAQVDVILKDAVTAVEELALKPIDDVLIGVDGVVLTVDAVLELLCPILELLFEALKAVLVVVAEVAGDVTELLQILPIVIETVGCLLRAICQITGVVFANALVVKLQAFLQIDVIVYVFTILGCAPIAL
ncbi:hypothetical protein BJV78DRAFT_929814 [Lactifluus subvellereus]|nr:hypothetical protein BJV78DRAFT_929814 [Lactifluus subvellereus]